MWRWTRKWTKRTLLLLAVVTLFVGIAYQIYRPFPFRAGDKELAETRGELDRSEPNWTSERIEAEYRAKLATRAKNSFEVFVVRHHDHALRACDSALPGNGDVLAVELREVFDSLQPQRAASSPERRAAFSLEHVGEPQKSAEDGGAIVVGEVLEHLPARLRR